VLVDAVARRRRGIELQEGKTVGQARGGRERGIIMKKGSDMDAKETTEREVGRRLPYSDPLAPITSFRCDYALRKQVCLLEEGKRGCGCFRVVLFFHSIRFSSLRSNLS
jgi:hypothetical protein